MDDLGQVKVELFVCVVRHGACDEVVSEWKNCCFCVDVGCLLCSM